MARGKLKFKQRDVVRAVKAVQLAGVEVGKIRISPDGWIEIVPGKPESVKEQSNEWDEV